MLMRLMSKGEYLIVPKGTKFTGSGKLGLNSNLSNLVIFSIQKLNITMICYLYQPQSLDVAQNISSNQSQVTNTKFLIYILTHSDILKCGIFMLY